MIGISIAFTVLLCNIYWFVEHNITKNNFFDRYNVKEYGLITVTFYIFTLCGVGGLIFYCF